MESYRTILFRKAIILLLGNCLLIVLFSCKETVVRSESPQDMAKNQVNLIQAQEISVRQEIESIHSFVARSGWNMEESGTGLQYEIYQSDIHEKISASPGDAIIFSYTLYLLNGNKIEEYTPDHPRTVILGTTEIPEGLKQALMMMKKGECGRFIVPSHLAYGFSGDGDKIPSRASLLYDIHILDIKIPPQRR